MTTNNQPDELDGILKQLQGDQESARLLPNGFKIVKDEAMQRLNALIDKKVREARIDELDSFNRDYIGKDHTARQAPVSYEYRNHTKAIIRRGLEDRITELGGRPEAKLDDIFVQNNQPKKGEV